MCGYTNEVDNTEAVDQVVPEAEVPDTDETLAEEEAEFEAILDLLAEDDDESAYGDEENDRDVQAVLASIFG